MSRKSLFRKILISVHRINALMESGKIMSQIRRPDYKSLSCLVFLLRRDQQRAIERLVTPLGLLQSLVSWSPKESSPAFRLRNSIPSTFTQRVLVSRVNSRKLGFSRPKIRTEVVNDTYKVV